MLKDSLLSIIKSLEGGNNLGEPVTIVGASKTMPVEDINEAIRCGLKVVAENKVQEFRQKYGFIDNSARWHFIGHLQTNKVKYLVGKVDLIQSVDSIHLGQAISDECVKKKVTQDILMEVNIGGELSKSGFNPDNAVEMAKELSKLPNVKLKGLMAMLPHVEDQALLVSLCKKMRSLYDELKSDGFDFEYLSMGMSADYKIAVQNGSNMIRLGSVIFGKRNYEEKI
ncbi:MAG: YggS family pyridoxal phosphate-dependent enzyme [Clostridiales bacterium]|nr:YggS family pyridoxal phosphate-dependent enzyme [Clostridiales bacterium]